MSTLQTRLGDLITSLGTDYKTIRTWITGSATGDLSGLATTDKTSIIAAINEVKTGSSGSPADATTTIKGIVYLATGAEAVSGTDAGKALTAAALTSKIDTDTTLANDLDTRLPSQHAVKTYVDTAVSGATIADASTTVKGKVQLATNAEAVAGTDALKATTPASVAAVFSDRIDTSTSLGTSSTKVASQNAVKVYVDSLIDAANALVYKGVIDASTNPNWPAANAGWMYIISVAGKIGGAAGQVVEAGDMVICKVDASAAGTDASVGANWAIIQKNIDGAITGPASSTAGNLATFSGTTGKVVQDAGVAVSTDGTFSANSDSKVPTEKAIKTYAGATFYTQAQLGNPDTDLAALYAAAKA